MNGPSTPSLPAPPGVVRRRTQTATVSASQPPVGSSPLPVRLPGTAQPAYHHVGTPLPSRLPGAVAPRSEPVNVRDLERLRQKKNAGAGADKKQQQDLISSEDSWTLTREREERYRAEIEAQVRQEMAAEEEMRKNIEAQVRLEMEQVKGKGQAFVGEAKKKKKRVHFFPKKKEMEAHRLQLEEKLRREMEMQIMKVL